MKAVVVRGVGEFSIEEVPEPVVGPKDVLIEIAACGICGTDVHIIDGEFPMAKFPLIIGHEFGGTVKAVGDRVVGFKIGDRVGADPNVPCGECFFCQRGRGNLCERWTAVGVTGFWGGFSELVAVPEKVVYPLPDTLDFQAGALVEPVSCVVHGFHVLAPRVGESYLIIGAGPMGLQNAQVARYNGAGVVALVDTNPKRLEIARSFGFDVIGASLDEVKHVAPRGFDNVIEATGNTKVAEMAIKGCIRGGKLLVFGVCPPHETVAWNPFEIFRDEISILGTMAVHQSYGPAIDVIAAGALDTAKMVTHTFPIEQFADALQVARDGSGLKVQVTPR